VAYPFKQNVCHARSEGPPGTLIYTKSPYSIYEVDGEEHKAWSPAPCAPAYSNLPQLFTQNLSLFAKLFLDNKSVFFDVSSFNYYLLVQEPTPSSSDHPQIVGFFSKEKMSWDNNNLACILVFPPWQRQGLGKILMGISYELSKRERNVGGPEKPLSELGRKGYLKFWEARVASAILGVRNKTTLTVQEIADLCWMVRDDVMIALKEMGFLEPRKRGAAMLVSKSRVRQWASVNGIDLLPPVAVSCFLDDWVPEVLDYTNI